MATIVRVKRRRADEPMENIVASCKRKKSNPEDSTLQSSLKFAGTVLSRDDVSKHIRDAIRKEKLQKEYRQHSVDITAKTRQNYKKNVKAARFKVVSSFRSKDLDNLDHTKPAIETQKDTKENKETNHEGAHGASNTSAQQDGYRGASSDTVFQLYDVELTGNSHPAPTYESLIQESQSSSGITCNAVPLVQEQVIHPGSEEDYVYDLYFTNNRDFSFRLLESALTVEAFSSDLVYGNDQVGNEDEEVYDDEDDSNDEGNWRNDYPDEDPYFVENQDAEYYYGGDINEREAFAEPGDEGLADWMHTRCNIEDVNELSSEDEDFAYFSQPLNLSSLNGHHTDSYEHYRQRVVTEIEDEDQGDIEENDDND